MSIADKIQQEIKLLPEDKQLKVLNFIKHLSEKQSEEEIDQWNKFSLSSALEGLEDNEVEYTLDDIKEKYTDD